MVQANTIILSKPTSLPARKSLARRHGPGELRIESIYVFFTRNGNDCWAITVHDGLHRGALDVGRVEQMMGPGTPIRTADMLAQAEQGLLSDPSDPASHHQRQAGAIATAAQQTLEQSTGRMSVDAG